MKKRIISKALAYLIVFSMLLSNFINLKPSIKAEEANKPVTYAKYNSQLADIGGNKSTGVKTLSDPGTAWVYEEDTIYFNVVKKSAFYIASKSNGDSWIDLYYDKQYITTGDDYWISVLFQSNKNFYSYKLDQIKDYYFELHTGENARADWSYSTITFNGEVYKLATAKISGFDIDQTVTGVLHICRTNLL